jgi:hypothetical protein
VTRLSIDLPDATLTALRAQAKADGYKSLAEYARSILADACGLSIPRQTWGRSKDAQLKVVQLKTKDEQLKPKDTQLQKQVTHLAIPEVNHLALAKPIRLHLNAVKSSTTLSGAVDELTYEDIDE